MAALAEDAGRLGRQVGELAQAMDDEPHVASAAALAADSGAADRGGSHALKGVASEDASAIAVGRTAPDGG